MTPLLPVERFISMQPPSVILPALEDGEPDTT
jgi:hypothetical protein